MRAISYASLWVSYVVLQLACLRLGMPLAAGVGGLLGILACAWHLDIYHNPFLTDAFGLMALCVMTYALLTRSFLVFAVAACIGVLARETTVFLVPVWLLHSVRQGTALLGASTILILLPRILLPPDAGATLGGAFQEHGLPLLSTPLVFAGKVIWSWRMVWILMGLGILLLTRRSFVRMEGGFLALFAGACFASLLATDLGRMFALLTPVAAIATAECFRRLLRREAPHWWLGLASLLLAQAVLAGPNVLIGEEQLQGWVAAKRTLFVLGAGFGIAMALFLRNDLVLAWRVNRRYLRAMVAMARHGRHGWRKVSTGTG